ncbi:MAG: hypothetical protein ACK4J0_03865 [Candidatus Anstonellaceae archaeon]
MVKKNFFLYEIFLFFILFLAYVSAGSLADLRNSMLFLCQNIYCLLPPISMLLVIAAAVTFAAGQLASAETRARATGWATAMIVGALFGFILSELLPMLITLFYGDKATCSAILFE